MLCVACFVQCFVLWFHTITSLPAIVLYLQLSFSGGVMHRVAIYRFRKRVIVIGTRSSYIEKRLDKAEGLEIERMLDIEKGLDIGTYLCIWRPGIRKKG